MDKKRVSTKKKTTSSFGNMDMSKLQPQARELEEAVLGALMLEKYAPEKVASYLKPTAFYVDAHQLIYEGIMQLFADACACACTGACAYDMCVVHVFN